MLHRYLNLSLRGSLSVQKTFLWCLNPACKSGHEHIDGQIFTCHECGHKMCTLCEANWHPGETCAQHQERRRIREEQEANSLNTVNAISKMCPKCTCKVEKIGGCDHMTCKLVSLAHAELRRKSLTLSSGSVITSSAGCASQTTTRSARTAIHDMIRSAFTTLATCPTTEDLWLFSTSG